MRKIGIIGCEGRHALHFGRLFNIEQSFPGYKATHIWGGDAPELLATRQSETAIPIACDTWQEVIEQTDAALVVPRLGAEHFEPAKFAIENQKPVFVDKPFTLDEGEAIQLIRLAEANDALLTGGSTLCFDPILNEQSVSKANDSAMIAYKAEPDSPHGGYAFYGSHLTDLCARVFGINAHAVSSKRQGEAVSSCVFYDGTHVLLHSAPDIDAPYITYANQREMRMAKLDDKGCYKRGMEHFIQMIERRTMLTAKWAELLFSVKLLDALLKSQISGEIVNF